MCALQMVIDGKSDVSGRDYFEVINPATEATIAQIPHASGAEVAQAVAGARRAFDVGPWLSSPRRVRQNSSNS